jgi:hypothetical protein
MKYDTRVFGYSFFVLIFAYRYVGYAVALLVAALRYQLKGRSFDSRRGHLDILPRYDPEVDSARNRGYFLGVNAAGPLG